MSIDIEPEGELSRGAAVFDRRGIPHWQQNIDVLTSVDAQGVPGLPRPGPEELSRGSG